MKEIRVKNFRCVEISAVEYKVYFSLHGEERWIGYYNGLLGGSEEADEKRLTNSICDYSEVISKWNISDTRTVYKVNVYDAYRMDETGIKYMFVKPDDTIYYKHEILDYADFRFPKWADGELVTEDNESFSFVSVEGIKTFKFKD